MDLRRALSDECYIVIQRAGEMAAQRGRALIESADLLCAIAEFGGSSGAEVIASVSTELSLDEEAVREEIQAKHAERVAA